MPSYLLVHIRGDLRYYVATAQRYNNQLLTFRKSRD